MISVWLPIKRYPNYEVSICGMVRNITTKRILKPIIGNNGYYFVNLSKNGNSYPYNIHRLVAKQFIPKITDDNYIDHINNNRLDNTFSNLRWVSSQQNCFNSSLRNDNTSGSKGISLNKLKQKWECYIFFNSKKIHLGYFVDLEDEKQMRIKKAKELFGEYINACEL